jgi:ABC-type transport system substrate-binding protein/DNA-binding SARP family transcriptional activator/streptogramin lyase
LYKLLGTVEATADGALVSLGGPRQRSVLADLALHAGRTVASSQLIDDIWGERAPATAGHTLETYVSRLRQALGSSAHSDSSVVTRPTGYMLLTAPGSVDVEQFRDLAAQGADAAQRGNAAAAVDLLAAALAVWRGPALADVRDAPFATLAADRLEGERLTSVELLMDARLLLGHHAELVTELEGLVVESPYRERLHAQLMTALYRSGRQAEALAAFRRARGHLVDELGIEPGPHLRELELAILRHDPELLPAAANAAKNGTIAHSGGASKTQSARPALPDEAGLAVTESVTSRRHPLAWLARFKPPARQAVVRWGIAGLAIVAVGGIIVPVALTSVPVHRIAVADGIAELSASGTSLVRSVTLAGSPDAAVSADGSLWVASAEEDAVYRINPVTDSLVQAIAVGSGPSALATTGSDVWVVNTLDGSVSRINVAVDRVVQTVVVGGEPTGIASGSGLLWVTDDAASSLLALNPVSGQPVARVKLPSPGYGVAFGAGSLWVTSPSRNSVTRVNPHTDSAYRPIRVGSGPTAVVFGLGSVWIANELDSTVTRLDPVTGRAATIPAGDGVDALMTSGHFIWAADRLATALTRIGVRGGGTGSTLPLGGTPVALAAVDGRIWVAIGPAENTPAVYGTLRVVSVLRPTSIDPALQYPSMGSVFGQSTYDTLVTFQKTGGSAGLQLVPDLAMAMPAVSGAGTVYTFTLRRGLRYSTGRLVLAGDFRYAIERVMDLNPAAASFLDGIVGATACTPGGRCDLSRGIIIDNAARTVTFLLTARDPDFLYKLAFAFTAPVPGSVPMRDTGGTPVPGTGPYVITQYVPGREAVFTRNPHFREWSAAAQPAGSLASIVWTFGNSVGREEAEIADGKADWTNDPLPGVAGLIARYSGEVHVNPMPEIVFAAFNTRAAPFKDPRVRQAFSLAADRASFVRMLGGPDLASPTCQILPRGIPGYEPYCPFTADATDSGAWIGPDLAAARQLVAASGTSGMPVTVWSDNVAPDPTTGAFTVSVLRRIGYEAALRVVAPTVLQQEVNDSRNNAQATDGSWLADYPSASDFFDLLFRCSAFRLADPADTRNGSFYCDPAVDRQMNSADAQQANDPAAAAATWTAVDRAVTSAAPWVPLAVLDNVDFLSTRVTNYQYNLFFGIVLDQLRIRR